MGNRTSIGIRGTLTAVAAAALAACRAPAPDFSCAIPDAWEPVPHLEGSRPSLNIYLSLPDGQYAGAIATLDKPRTEAEFRAEVSGLAKDLADTPGFSLGEIKPVLAGAFSGWGVSMTVLNVEPGFGHGRWDAKKTDAVPLPPPPRLFRETLMHGMLEETAVHITFRAPADSYDALKPAFERILETLKPPK